MHAQSEPRPPRTAMSGGLAVVATAVLGLSYWLATQPGARKAQEGVVRRLNDPPEPLGALLALVNPLLRPVPIFVVTAVLLGWVLVTCPSGPARLEVLRAAAVAYLVAEVLAQVLKRVADEPRPLAVLPRLDTHGYPSDPIGNAFPSAHTAVTVGVVCALWPWMRRYQRIVGAAMAVLVPLHRVYIGAHWPIDLVGGAAIGLIAGACAWLVATLRPIRGSTAPDQPER